MASSSALRVWRYRRGSLAVAFSCFFFLTGLACSAADLPPLLKAAFERGYDNDGHWAYTETSEITIDSGKKTRRLRTVIRFDPSKPYPQQYTPVLIKSRPPDSDDFAEYRKKGEDRLRKLEKAAQQRAAAQKKGETRTTYDRMAEKLDLGRITVDADTVEYTTYRIPLRKGSKANGLELDKFDLSMRVNKEQRQIDNFLLHVREGVRMNLVAKVKAGDIVIAMSQPDAAYAPVMTSMKGNLDVSVFFFKDLATSMDRTRSDFKRVKPYDDRFQVEIGPLKVLDF